ncbi:hypothetical protein SESBI_29871 [Sesbania bispinosa]|nr:hypothetical protein SESBI_29871 [Sesbania bispinosa]
MPTPSWRIFVKSLKISLQKKTAERPTETKKDKERSDTLLEQWSKLLTETEEKLKESEKKLVAEQIVRKTDSDNLRAEITFQYETGFKKTIEQVWFLNPELNVEEVGAFKEIQYGKLVEIPDDEE